MSQATLQVLLDRLHVAGAGGAEQLAQEIANASAGSGFGADTIVQQPDSTPTSIDAWESIISLSPNTAGAAFGKWVIKTAASSVKQFHWALTYIANNIVMLLGDPADGDGIMKNAQHALQMVIAGTNYLSFDQSNGVRANVLMSMNASKFMEAQTGGTAVATTITLPGTGNMWPLTAGTGTLNSIVAAAWQAGTRGVLICASGITVTNNVAGTGATILTSTGASIVTASKRALPISYDGTNWIVEG